MKLWRAAQFHLRHSQGEDWVGLLWIQAVCRRYFCPLCMPWWFRLGGSAARQGERVSERDRRGFSLRRGGQLLQKRNKQDVFLSHSNTWLGNV